MLKDNKTISTSFLVKQLPTATLFVDMKLNIVYASDKLTSLFCDDRINIAGQSLFTIFPELNLKWKDVLTECLKGTSNSMGIQSAIDLSGNEKFYDWSNATWYDSDENIIGAIIQLNNVSSAIESDIELEKAKILLKQQSELSKIGIWEYDLQKSTVSWCPMTKKIHEVALDYKPNIDTAIEYYKEGHSRNAISMAIFEATDKGKPWSLKLQIITAKGNEKWIMAAGKPIFEKGKIARIMGIFQDINEQVISETKTKGDAKLLKTLIDNLPLNVFIKDRDSKKTLVNKSECEYLGVTDANELLGKTDFDLYPFETAKLSRDEDLKVMETLKPILGQESVSIKNDGTETSFLSSKIPLLDEKGNATGLVGISLDITNLKHKEQELRKLINVTSLQNKKLINFAHIVSHNLRSHSANFSMLLDFLVNEKNEEEKDKIVNMLTQASDNLLETLENLNEVVTLSTNTQAKKESVKLRSKIANIQGDLSNLTDTNKLIIINDVSKDINIQIVPAYLDSILMNFITNGVKYKHPDREPIIKFSTEKKGEYTLLNIEDNGLGIDLEKYGRKLFGMYKTFHTNKDSRGIGLYITKNQVEAMRGKIEVESKLGEGTKFKVFFK
ncbi:MAG: PAS domain S-box-containing protein [Maribacter sp.]|jgi:PAS domain S-box-containing protein